MATSASSSMFGSEGHAQCDAMNVPELLDEVRREVPTGAPVGTRWKASSTLITPHGTHSIAIAARIDARGERREQFWCDGVRVELPVLLRLTCTEGECPHVVQVRAQWLAYHRAGPARVAFERPLSQPLSPSLSRPLSPSLIAEVAVHVGQHRFVARPARFPCFTHCPNGAHPPMTIDKTGFDLFDESTCVGGGTVETGGVRQPRLPTLRAAEAFVLARHLETLAALGVASETSRPGQDPAREGD